ncbi:hypothetical protein [Actinoallomurus bryophytorum]|uniref:hypothetical protein n=1 Tax=Actinoallomurus bryophytorum TaxID=1490222 RepID=UPI00114D7DD5|nr:hypothetical protein [Actinoallomurus bryophytorum]
MSGQSSGSVVQTQAGALWFLRLIAVAGDVSVTIRAIEARGVLVGVIATISADVFVLMFLFLKNPYGELNSRRYLLVLIVSAWACLVAPVAATQLPLLICLPVILVGSFPMALVTRWWLRRRLTSP